ncbi:MAG: hypothetical protein IPP40_11545 [bacterium]|nr:hypothetical protein [bacterium]
MFAVTLFSLFALAYFAAWSMGILIGERFLLFSTFALHLLIALFILDRIKDLVNEGGLKSKTLKLQLLAILILFIAALPFREQDIRGTGSLLISTFVKRRHAETMREEYQFLEQYLDSSDIVLAEGMNAWPLPALTGARTVFQRHGNPLLVTELETRQKDTEAFLKGDLSDGEQQSSAQALRCHACALGPKESGAKFVGFTGLSEQKRSQSSRTRLACALRYSKALS